MSSEVYKCFSSLKPKTIKNASIFHFNNLFFPIIFLSNHYNIKDTYFYLFRSIKARDVFYDDHTHDAKLYANQQPVAAM